MSEKKKPKSTEPAQEATAAATPPSSGDVASAITAQTGEVSVAELTQQQAPELTTVPAATAAAAEPVMEGNVWEDAVVKSGFRKIRIPGFAGLYKDAAFADDGTCDRVSETTLADLKSDFPGAEIEELI